MEFSHYSVMLPQCMEGLHIKPDGTYIDGTAGGAGHSKAIAERLTTGRLLSFDRDPDAVAEAAKRLAPYPTAEVIHREFARIPEVRIAYTIAKKIAAQREKEPFTHTGQLVELIYATIPAAARREGGHPAKRVFQALRIAVNSELDQLSQCLDTAFDCLNPGGRFVILTFHSLEDRMVKQKFAAYCQGCTCPPDFPVCVCGKQPRARLINRKPIEADAEELAQNSRSKSAKLRILEKL